MSTSPRADEFARLDGKTAVVTGASSGIGRAVARHLAAAGADLVVHARARRAELENVAAEIQALGRRADVVLGDLAQDVTQTELVEQAWRWGKDIQIWVNNAGGDVLTGSATDWSFEQKLDYLWSVDVRPPSGCLGWWGSE